MLQTVRQARLRRTRQQLQEAAFMARPTFCGPLLEIGALLARLREVQVRQSHYRCGAADYSLLIPPRVGSVQAAALSIKE